MDPNGEYRKRLDSKVAIGVSNANKVVVQLTTTRLPRFGTDCLPHDRLNGRASTCRTTRQEIRNRFLPDQKQQAMTQATANIPNSKFTAVAANLAATAKALHARGWLLGTGGNLSAVVQQEPLLLAMSPSGVDKGELLTEQILLVDENARIVNGTGKPSDETLLHSEIVKQRQAGAVLHTHSVWNTIISDLFADERGFAIEGYEMLKGLAGVHTHEHREWLPIIENSQDMRELAARIGAVLTEQRNAHGILLHRHGLYTWGENLREARRHIEILEFLIEARGRTLELKRRGD